MINIERCTSACIGDVMAFIDAHWSKNHVLATSRRLMDWQYLSDNGDYNFLVARQGKDILGVLGFIPTMRFDEKVSGQNVSWLALWKVREGTVAGLGLRLLKALEEAEPHLALAVNGINLTHPPMYRSLGYCVMELKQFYLCNPDIPPALVTAPTGREIMPRPARGAAEWVALSSDDLLLMPVSTPHALPHKTPAYFARRFLAHPFYTYHVFSIRLGNVHKALIAARIAVHGNSKALRLVDFSGDASALAESGDALSRLMCSMKVEYADFWNYGLADSYLQAAGFKEVEAQGDIIVPTYFEPFVPKNGRIICAVKTSETLPVVICRADGDQDRPNRLEDK
jgi:hypothetical protein